MATTKRIVYRDNAIAVQVNCLNRSIEDVARRWNLTKSQVQQSLDRHAARIAALKG